MLKVFEYISELDCFKVNPEFKEITDDLGISEWNEVVWIGRYFMLDNDYGEHWFDNWDKREEIQEKAKEMGYDPGDLLIIDPSRLQNEKDGPCHTDEERKMFWTDVCKSLHISLETIFAESRKIHKKNLDDTSLSLSDLEYKIEQLSSKLKNHEQISRP